ncbi:MAG: hypothetical protein ACREKL_08550 [Chthoniobacterales bacterium]
MNRSLLPPKLPLFAACLVFAVMNSSRADLLAIDEINYTSITNGTASTGAGLGSWTSTPLGANPGPSIQPGLTYSTLPVADSSVKIGYGGKATENLLSPVTTGTVWASFLIQGGGDSGGDPVGALITGSSGSLFVGFGGPNDGLSNQFGLGTTTNGGSWTPLDIGSFVNVFNISNTTIHYIVLSMDLTTSEINLWIDPTIEDTAAGTLGFPANTRTLTVGNLTGWGVEGIGGALPTVDEFRLGTTSADMVAPVPEPRGYLVLGGIVLACCLMRRKTFAA